MADPFLKLYRVKEFNVWPYEGVTSVTLVDRKARAALTADFEGDTSYRVYRRHPDQFITLAPMEPYEESWEGSYDGREISPYQLLADRPIALQIEYVLFQSYKASDQSKVQGLVENIKNGNLTPRNFPLDIRPARVIVSGDDESHPSASLRLEGTRPPNHTTSAFYVSEQSEIPYINNHTVPEGIDYAFVQAAVIHYDFYKVRPTYDDLMNKLDRYCAWFEKLPSGTHKAPLKNARTKRSKTK